MKEAYNAIDLMKSLRISATRVYKKSHHKNPENAKLVILKQTLLELEKKHKAMKNKLHPKYVDIYKKISQLKKLIRKIDNSTNN